MKNSIKWMKNKIKKLFSKENKIFSQLDKNDRLVEDTLKKLETIKEEKKEGEVAVFVPKYSTYIKLENYEEEPYREIKGIVFPLGKSYLIILNEKELNHTELSKLILAHELFGHVDFRKRIGKKLEPFFKLIKIVEKDEENHLLKELYYYYQIIFEGLGEAYANLMEMSMGLFNSLKKRDRSAKIVAERFIQLALTYLPYEETYEEVIKKGIEEVIKMQIEGKEKEAFWLLSNLIYMTGTIFLFKIDKIKGGHIANSLTNYAEKKQFSYNEIKELILKLWEYKKEMEKKIDKYLEIFITS